MRVTAIEPSGNLYGSEQALLDVVQGTRSRGFDWDVVVPKNGPFEDVLKSAQIPVRALLPPQSHLIPRWKKVGGYVRLALHLARQRPSVLYLNQAGMLRAASIIGKRLGIPIVCQVQTLEDARFIAASESLRHAATSFICNSRFIADASQIPFDKVSVLYQPIVAPAARTKARHPDMDVWRVGILGRIAKSKGHYVLLDAARELADRGRSDIQFVVIGEGISERDTREFVRAVSDRGLSSTFDFRGFRRDVGLELDRVHALAMPSLAEPLGRVVLDACVARRPIILSDSGGLGEFSHALDIGIRVPASDPGSLASSIADLLDNYEVEYERFKTAAERTEQTLTPEPYLSAIGSVLENAAKGRAASLEWFGTRS